MTRRKRPRGATPSDTSPAVLDRLGSVRRLRPWLPLALVLVLLALLYPEPMFQGRVYGGADTVASEAFRQVGDAARADGEYPLWNPYIFGGLPSFGSLAYTIGVYPPTLVFEFLQGLGMPPLTWLIGHLIFGALGVWWLLRRWRLPPAACLLGCVGWLWFARVVAWSVHGHGSKLGAAMYVPWLVGLTWEILARDDPSRNRLRAVALASLLLGLQFLRGHVQISFYTLLLLGFLTVWNLVWPLNGGPRPALVVRLRRGGLMALVVVIGFAIGTPLLLPVHEYAAMSTRGAGGASGAAGTAYDYATNWSLAPEDLAAVVVPTAAGFGKATYLGRMPFNDYPNYLGPLLLLLAGAAWFSQRRCLVIALLAGSVFSVLLAMGRFSPGLYQLFYEVVPYFNKFRVPSMIMVLPALAVAVLAGLGASVLVDESRLSSLHLRRAAFVVLGLGVLWMMGATNFGVDAYREKLVAMAALSGKQAAPVILDAAAELHRAFLVRQGLVLLAAGGAVFLASGRPAFRRTWLVPALVVVLAVDLGSVARLVTHPERSLQSVVRTADGGGRLAPAAKLVRHWSGPARVQVDPDLATILQDVVGHGRLLPLGKDATNNAYMTVDVRSAGGYHPAKPAAGEAIRQRLFDRLPAGRLARWFGVAAVTYPGQLSADQLALLRQGGLDLESPGRQAGSTVVYPVRNSWPRARLVDAWQPVSVLPEGDALAPFLDAIAAGTHDPGVATVLDREPDPAPQPGPETLPVPRLDRDGFNEVVIRVANQRPALLLLADLWAPGWRATVDGVPTPVLRADLTLRAVALPAGAQEVRFEYHDSSLTRGLILAVAGILATLILLVVGWRRGRAAAVPAPNPEA